MKTYTFLTGKVANNIAGIFDADTSATGACCGCGTHNIQHVCTHSNGKGLRTHAWNFQQVLQTSLTGRARCGRLDTIASIQLAGIIVQPWWQRHLRMCTPCTQARHCSAKLSLVSQEEAVVLDVSPGASTEPAGDAERLDVLVGCETTSCNSRRSGGCAAAALLGIT